MKLENADLVAKTIEEQIMKKSQESQLKCAWCRKYFTPTKRRKTYCSTICYNKQKDQWAANKSRQNEIPKEIAEFLLSKYSFSYSTNPPVACVDGEPVHEELLSVLFVDVYCEGISQNRQLIRDVIMTLCLKPDVLGVFPENL